MTAKTQEEIQNEVLRKWKEMSNVFYSLEKKGLEVKECGFNGTRCEYIKGGFCYTVSYYMGNFNYSDSAFRFGKAIMLYSEDKGHLEEYVEGLIHNEKQIR